jgi:hypothetical protein
MEELVKLLENVSDTYDDFVCGVRCSLKRHSEYLDDVIQYIKDNPDKDSSDITEYLEKLGI